MKCSVRLVCAFGRIGVRLRLIEEWEEVGEAEEVGQWMALKLYMHLFHTDIHPFTSRAIVIVNPWTSHESRLVLRGD